MYRASCQQGELPPSLCEALVVVIPKPGKDPIEVVSCRPLSMLNIDKILGKTLANRLLPVISTLIHPDQCGFVLRRATYHSTRRLGHIIDAVFRDTDHTVAAFLDFKKAFNTFSWAYLKQVLE
ncbi:hypothetical protein NDU88_004619 [Pleurodeles waltl]|uniref:Reverse transcriptase domain-containing protein n=1 Tax=Pleurodeles waltl TaxID=8319 RepID=A0AAV7UGZ3_PLEWA|nr:hypothetical protein NDU88_004619 [Pleurodeles waltl]